MNELERRSTRDKVREPAGVAKGSDAGNGYIYMTVRNTGKFYKTRFLRGAPPSGSDMNKNGATTKGGGGGV